MSSDTAGTDLAAAAVTPEPDSARDQHRWFYAFALLLTLAVAALYLTSQYSGGPWAWIGLPLDDGWIHLDYARSLAEHGGFFYNSGVPEAGMSSPLWVILLAAVYKTLTPLGVSPQWCAKSLSLLLSVGVPILTYHLTWTLTRRRTWAWLAGILVIVEPNLAFGNVSGMEVSLFTLLTLLALWLSWQQRYLLCGIILGLGVVTRAEGVLTAVLIGSIPLIALYAKRATVVISTMEELALGLKLFLPSLVLGGLWALYNYSVSGNFLPNTFYVKHNFALGLLNLTNLYQVLLGYMAHLALFRGPILLADLALCAAAIWAFYRRKQIAWGVTIILLPLLQIYAFSINIKVVALEAPWTYFTRRYPDFLIPLWIILFVVGAAVLWEKAASFKSRIAVRTIPVVCLAVALMLGVNVARLNRYFIEEYSWNTENIEQVQVGMGQWVADNLPADATIALTDAGAVRFLSRPSQTVIDFLGLNCHNCGGRPMAELLNEFKPDYAIFFRTPDIAAPYFLELHSILAIRNTVLGGNELVALRVMTLPPWPPKQ